MAKPWGPLEIDRRRFLQLAAVLPAAQIQTGRQASEPAIGDLVWERGPNLPRPVKGQAQGGDLLAAIQLVPVLTEAQQQLAKQEGEELKQDVEKDVGDFKPPQDLKDEPPRAVKAGNGGGQVVASDGKGKKAPPKKDPNAEPTEPEDAL